MTDLRLVDTDKVSEPLTLEQAEKRYVEAERRFSTIREYYDKDIVGRFRINMKEPDKEVLMEVVRELLHLPLERCVQDEINPLDPHADISHSLFYKIPILQERVLLYLTKFRDTGVELLGYRDISDF
ncbi:MAG: hypothetical protein AABX19_01195 [Nanoarchaeota archaeon]